MAQNNKDRRGMREPPPLPKTPPPPQREYALPPRHTPRNEGGLSLGGILNMLGLGGRMDSDRILVLGILLLLSGEDCDQLLLLALMYILL